MLVPRRSKTGKGSKLRNPCGVKTPKSPRLHNSNGVKTPKSPRMHNLNGVKATKSLNFHNSNGVKITRSPTFQNSCGVASNFRIMTGIRNKIIALRDLLDLSPCDGSESANELLISTLRDLHKLFPSINPNFSLLKIDGTSIHEKVRCFCDILKSIGQLWTGNDDWMVTCKENKHSKLNDFEYVLALLEDIIKLASERMLETPDEDEHEHEHEHEDEDEDGQTRETSPSPDTFEKNFSDTYSSNNSSLSSSPTSVLPQIITNASNNKNAKASITSPLLLSLKVQAAGNQNPVEVKHLSFHMIHNANQDSSYAVQLGSNVDEKRLNTEAKQDCELADLPEILLNSLEKASENGEIFWTGASNGEAVPARVTFDVLLPRSSISRLQSNVTEQSSVPPSPQILSPKITESQVPTQPQPDSLCESEEAVPSSPPAPITSGNNVTSPPPPPPPSPPITSKNRAVPLPPPPPPKNSENIHSPPPPKKSENVHSPPPPPPPPLSPHEGLKGMVTPHPLPPKASDRAVPAPPSSKSMRKVAAPPPPPTPTGKRAATPRSPKLAAPAPPPPMQMKKGGAPPPPPPSFAGAKNPRQKKTTTKLKRSSQMGNLYRSLKGKVEGSSLDGKQKGGKGKFNATNRDKPAAMADALAEMTRRSAYFQQIEEDVKNHAELIKEMKKAVASFHTSDMSELITFHNYVESHLEKLTDESQVLARFEDFPCKKLEALRTAATLYSKLDSIVSTLQNWQPASPVGQHLARAERYFNKIKGDVDTLERTKDEESKKLKTHKIQFDFGALVRIKELMVDVSSNCMELALKEKRVAAAMEKEGAGLTNEGSKKESAEQLWKAFQFAFRVYNFAGGQDERAEKLTKELAEVIETDLHR
ncbi:unnamed protein product [Withania somnifera]